MSKKILKNKRVIATVTNPLFHDRRMDRICSALADDGAEVLLLGVFRKGVPEPVEKRYEQHRFHLFFKKGFLFYAEYNLRLFFFLLFRHFDLLISVDLDSLPAGTLVSWLKRRKKIYDAHEYFTEVPEVENRQVVKWVWSSIAKMCIGKYNMTVTESLANVFKEKYGKTFQVVRNLPDYRPDPKRTPKTIDPEGKIKLLYIGYLNEGRGLEFLLEAMTHLDDRFELTLAGGGDIEPFLRKRIQQLKLSHRVEITGWIEPKDMGPLLERAHIGFNILEDRSASYYYSLANKTFDYMHYGIPAVHMDFPEYRAIQDEHECFILLASKDPVQIAQSIQNTIADPSGYERLSRNNLEASKSFTWRHEKGVLLDFLLEN